LLAPHFEKVHTVNFEKNKALRSCFLDSLSPKEILPKLEILLNERIIPGKSLLFLDELQDCTEAITALRYFYEEMPNLHVIGAGSLIEFALGASSFPVGRVNVRYLYPINFSEFLLAKGETQFLEVLANHDYNEPFSQAVHEHGLRLLQEYFIVGGMPESVASYLSGSNYYKSQDALEDLLALFKSDFPKYAFRKSELDIISEVFTRISQLVCNKIKYVNISRDYRQDGIKACIELLDKARLITIIRPTSGLPLAVNAKEHPLKILYLDIGLKQKAAGVPAQLWITNQDLFINNGQVAEQFVGQELLALSSTSRPELFYWNRDKRGSSAEVDYLYQSSTGLIPIEVKAGASGKLISLKMLLEANKDVPEGIKVSSENCSVKQLGSKQSVRIVPLYAFSSWITQSHKS